MLTLTIKKKWLDMILSEDKKEEYREIKPYWTTRFMARNMILFSDGSLTGCKTNIRIKNQYQKQSPKAIVTVTLDVGIGRKEWGAPDHVVYILKIIEVKHE